MLDRLPLPIRPIQSNGLATVSEVRRTPLPSPPTTPDDQPVISEDRNSTRRQQPGVASKIYPWPSPGPVAAQRPQAGSRYWIASHAQSPDVDSHDALPSLPPACVGLFERAYDDGPTELLHPSVITGKGAAIASGQPAVVWQHQRSVVASLVNPGLASLRSVIEKSWRPTGEYSVSSTRRVDGIHVFERENIPVDIGQIHQYMVCKIANLADSVYPRELVRNLTRIRRRYRPISDGGYRLISGR